MNDKQLSPHAACAAHIRKALAAAFPGTVFKVTSQSFSGGNSVHIGWTDGPKSKDVEAITNQYQYGSFDGMQDLYSADNSRDDIPQVKYVSASRSLSDAVVARIKASIELQFNLGKDQNGNDITVLDLDRYNSYWSQHGYGMVSRVESGELDCKILSDAEIDELLAARALKSTVALAETVVEQLRTTDPYRIAQEARLLDDPRPDPKFKVNDRVDFQLPDRMSGTGTVAAVISRDEWHYVLKDIEHQSPIFYTDVHFPEIPESHITGHVATELLYPLPSPMQPVGGNSYARFLQVSRALDQYFDDAPVALDLATSVMARALKQAVTPHLRDLSEIAVGYVKGALDVAVTDPEFQALLKQLLGSHQGVHHD
jgi:hypothetical protein